MDEDGGSRRLSPARTDAEAGPAKVSSARRISTSNLDLLAAASARKALRGGPRLRGLRPVNSGAMLLGF